MAVYLIDFENVRSEGLRGTQELKPGDQVVIFYSVNADTLTFEAHDWIINSAATVRKYKIVHGGKNALDFQLSTYLGYLLRGGEDNQFYIISKDRGYHYVLDFWAYLCREHHATIICSASISDALRGRRSAYVYPEQLKAQTDTAKMEAEEQAAIEAGLSEEEIEKLLEQEEELTEVATDLAPSDEEETAKIAQKIEAALEVVHEGTEDGEIATAQSAEEMIATIPETEVETQAEVASEVLTETETEAASETLEEAQVEVEAEVLSESQTEAQTEAPVAPETVETVQEHAVEAIAEPAVEVTFVADIPHKERDSKSKRGRKKKVSKEAEVEAEQPKAEKEAEAETKAEDVIAEEKPKRGRKKSAKKSEKTEEAVAPAEETITEAPVVEEKKAAKKSKGKSKKQVPEVMTIEVSKDEILKERIGTIMRGASFSEPIDEATVSKATATFIVEASDKQDFYRRIVKLAGQKSGLEIYKLLRSEYNNLKQLI